MSLILDPAECLPGTVTEFLAALPQGMRPTSVLTAVVLWGSAQNRGAAGPTTVRELRIATGLSARKQLAALEELQDRGVLTADGWYRHHQFHNPDGAFLRPLQGRWA